MIRIAIYIVVFMIPAVLLGYIILQISPHISMSSLAVLTTGLILAAYFWYKKKRQNEILAAYGEDATAESVPAWLRKKRYPVFLAAASLFGSMAVFQSNKTDLYIDNASEKDISIQLSNEGTHLVKAGTYKKLRVAKGPIEATYNNLKKHFNITDAGKWIWNIDSLNTYFRSSVTYTNSIDLYKNGKNVPEEENPDFQLVKGEFFETHVDYVFDIPEKISVKRSRLDNKAVSKTVLYRFNQSGNDLPEISDTDVMDTVEVKSEARPQRTNQQKTKNK